MLIQEKPEESSIYVELIQKDTEAQILIKRENFNFSHEQLKEIGELRENFSGKMEISKKENSVFIRISLPLSFKSASMFNILTNPNSSIKITSTKPIRKIIKSFAKDDV